MAEEAKQEEKKCEGSKTMSMLLKTLIGLACIAAALYLLIGRQWWGYYTLPLIKGCAAPFLVLAGIITLAIAKE
jgi:hypothetical protein